MGKALAGKAVVITGAGRGIGAAYARHAASEGAKVVVNNVDAVCGQVTPCLGAFEGGQGRAFTARLRFVGRK